MFILREQRSLLPAVLLMNDAHQHHEQRCLPGVMGARSLAQVVCCRLYHLWHGMHSAPADCSPVGAGTGDAQQVRAGGHNQQPRQHAAHVAGAAMPQRHLHRTSLLSELSNCRELVSDYV